MGGTPASFATPEEEMEGKLRSRRERLLQKWKEQNRRPSSATLLGLGVGAAARRARPPKKDPSSLAEKMRRRRESHGGFYVTPEEMEKRKKLKEKLRRDSTRLHFVPDKLR